MSRRTIRTLLESIHYDPHHGLDVLGKGQLDQIVALSRNHQVPELVGGLAVRWPGPSCFCMYSSRSSPNMPSCWMAAISSSGVSLPSVPFLIFGGSGSIGLAGHVREEIIAIGAAPWCHGNGRYESLGHRRSEEDGCEEEEDGRRQAPHRMVVQIKR